MSKVVAHAHAKSIRKPSSTEGDERLQPIPLPKPMIGRGRTVFAALQGRKTVRAISDKRLSRQMLSNLLWAACGVNRKKGPFGGPGITAASASNSQEIALYVALEEGTYLYNAVLIP